MAINNNFYNSNANQPYPLSEQATGIDDSGLILPHGLLIDAHLAFPRTAGEYVYLSGITISDSLVSAVFLGADNPHSTSGFVPLAAITLQKPINAYQHYDVTPLYPGAGGWVVFGSNVNTDAIVGRFSTPAQSLLLPRCARAYRNLPIQSLGRLFKDSAFSGVVTLKAGPDMEVVKESVIINGVARDALVFRLLRIASGRNILQDYMSPCSTRPESQNCNKPGLQSINAVSPDCDGNINIQFTGNGVEVAPFRDCGGVTLDLPVGLAELCDAGAEPANAFDDACADHPNPPPPDDMSLSLGLPSASPSGATPVVGPLFFATNFAGGIPSGFNTRDGLFDGSATAPDDSSSVIAAIGSAGPNIMTYDNTTLLGAMPIYATATVLVTGDLPQRNGGVILNYQEVTPLTDPHIEYFMTLLDFNLGKLRLLRFDGSGFIEEFASPIMPLVLGHRYLIGMSAMAATPPHTTLRVALENADGTVLFDATTTTSKYLPATGRVGIGSIRSKTYFTEFFSA